MLKDDVTALIKANKSELSKLGVKSIAIFGSVAKATETPESDIDLLIEFDQPVGLFMFVKIQTYLNSILNHKVDLVSKDALHPKLRDRILKEAEYVF